MVFYCEIIEQLIVITIFSSYFFFLAPRPEILETFSELPESQETTPIHRYLMKEGERQIFPQKGRIYESESNYKMLLINNT